MSSSSSAHRLLIVGAKRTGFGAFGGSLASFTATQLAQHAMSAAVAHAALPLDAIDSVTIGNVAQTSTDAPYLARHAALAAGVREDVPALTVNRLCGSGFQALITGAHEILLNERECVLVGGTESMSQAPCVGGDGRDGVGGD